MLCDDCKINKDHAMTNGQLLHVNEHVVARSVTNERHANEVKVTSLGRLIWEGSFVFIQFTE